VKLFYDFELRRAHSLENPFGLFLIHGQSGWQAGLPSYAILSIALLERRTAYLLEQYYLSADPHAARLLQTLEFPGKVIEDLVILTASEEASRLPSSDGQVRELWQVMLEMDTCHAGRDFLCAIG